MNPSPDANAAPRLIPTPSFQRKLAVLGVSFAGLAVLGWVDFLTGYELGFFVFYSLNSR